MITMLFSTAGIPAGGLQMSVGDWTNPDIAPGRRNDERLDTTKFYRIADGFAVRPSMQELVTAFAARDASRIISDISQTRGTRRVDGIRGPPVAGSICCASDQLLPWRGCINSKQ